MAKKRKNLRKMSVSSAVIRFLIGMLLIACIVCAGFYLLFEVDYSRHLLNSDGTYASTRAYVLPADGSTLTPENSATPTAGPTIDSTDVPEPTATAEPTAEPTATPEPLVIISTLEPTAGPTAEPTAEPTATPEPTEKPTPRPTATPAATPEPDGTRIPETAFSDYKTGLKLPKTIIEGANVGISRCYISKLNYYQVMQINGWGFIDAPEFNGSTCITYALVTATDQEKGRVYLCENRDGVSRRIHAGEYASNVNAADFSVTIDTSDYESGEYELKLILQYSVDDKYQTVLCPFSTPHTFTVVEGEVVSAIPID